MNKNFMAELYDHLYYGFHMYLACYGNFYQIETGTMLIDGKMMHSIKLEEGDADMSESGRSSSLKTVYESMSEDYADNIENFLSAPVFSGKSFHEAVRDMEFW